VRHLLTDAKSMLHSTRLKFFRNREWEVAVTAKEHIAFLDDELCVVDRFINLRQREDIIQVRVTWQGFEDSESTWSRILLCLKMSQSCYVRTYMN
jgi:hypothetical protein